jgi:hypothetical protein
MSSSKKMIVEASSSRAPIADDKTKVHHAIVKSSMDDAQSVGTPISIHVVSGNTKISYTFENNDHVSGIMCYIHSEADGGLRMQKEMARYIKLTDAQTATKRSDILFAAQEVAMRQSIKDRERIREESATIEKYNQDTQEEEGSEEPPSKKGRYWG